MEGTALSVASLAHEVTKDLYQYYRAWKHCDQDVKDLRLRLLWLENAFKLCQNILDRPGVSADGTPLVRTALHNCTDATYRLREVLDRIRKESPPQGWVEKLKSSKRRACYPFMKRTVGEILDMVEECSDGLDLAVDLLHLDSSTEHYRKLQELDDKLVAIDAALEPLTTISSNVAEVKDQAETIRTDTSIIRHTQQSAEERETLKEVMDWLCPADYSQQQNDFFARRTSDTCKWFLESSEFLALRKGEVRTLVCTGQPGAGKTYLASTAINELLQSEDITTVGIAYIFCNYKRRDEQDITHCVAALARQLLYRKGSVPPLLLGTYHQHKSRNSRPSPGELTEALASLAQTFTATYIVIDALDEGVKNVCADLLSILQRKQVGSNLRLMLTTRPLREMLDLVETCQVLEVKASDTDVRLFLETQTKALIVRADTELQERIISAIVSAVDGMFLLAKFHMDSLKNCPSENTILKALAKLPKGSDTSVYAEVYSNAMDRICDQSLALARIAKDALSWITFAERPLNALELRHALAIDINAEMDDIVEEDLYDLDLVLSLCAGLIVEDEQSDTVRLVHYTAQKFFEDNWTTWLPNAESTIALGCLKYLSLESMTKGLCNNYEELQCRLEKYTLLYYSAKHWILHVEASARVANRLVHEPVQEAALDFLQNDKLVQASVQVEKGGYYHHQRTRGWHLIGRCGAESLVAPLLQVDPDCDCWDTSLMTPLRYAAQRGYSKVAKLLLDTRQVISGRYSQTLLQDAAVGGHIEVVRLLLDIGKADVNSRGDRYQSALLLAASGGHKDVVQLLLNTGQVDIDWRDNHGRTALSYGASSGCKDVVQLLLDTGQVDVDSRDNYGRTALSYGAERGSKEVVRLLLDTGQVDVDSRSNSGRTALSYSARMGGEGVVQLLLDTGQVDINSRDNHGRNALSHSAEMGDEGVVQLLLDTGQVDINSKDNHGRTALSHSADLDAKGVAQLLLDTGRADINSEDNDGRTPLLHGIDRGSESIIKLLLDTGEADVNAATAREGQTPLIMAVLRGLVSVVQHLLQTGQVDVNATDSNGWTPLMHAVDRGKSDIGQLLIRLLLDTGQVDVNLAGNAGYTPLHFAIANACVATVKILLESSQIRDLPEIPPKVDPRVSMRDYIEAVEMIETWREQPEDFEAALQRRKALREDRTLGFDGLQTLFGE